jgi:hypothetical protein
VCELRLWSSVRFDCMSPLREQHSKSMKMSMSTTLTNKSVMGRRNNRSTYECVIFSRSLAVAFAIISEVDLENWREISGTPATRKNPLSTKFFAFILAATHCSCKGVLREAIHLTLSSPLTTTTIYNLQHQHQHAAVQLHQHDHEHTPRSSAAGLPFKFQLLLVAPTDLLLFHGLHYNTINCIVHHHPHDPRHRT